MCKATAEERHCLLSYMQYDNGTCVLPPLLEQRDGRLDVWSTLWGVSLFGGNHMRRTSLKALLGGLFGAALLSTSSLAAADEENKVNIWNWSDYIGSTTVEDFTKATGIEANHVLFDSNELVEARLLSGSSGFDVIMMTSYYVPRLAQAGALQPFDKSKLTHYSNLDPKRMELLATIDKDNAYAVPYTEISVGIGYNTKKIAEVFGPDFKVDSWDVLFKPENAAKLKQCGIAVLDSPIEVISTVQHYLQKDPTSEKRGDYEEAKQVLTDLAKNVSYFHSSRYINDLASGDICMAIGYSGDILQAKDRAKAANRDYEVEYVFPKEGGLLWFDCWVLAHDAAHPDNAHKWVDYLLSDDVATSISNEIRYLLPVTGAIAKLDPALKDNPSVNLPPELLEKAYFPQVPSARQSKLHNEVWNYMKLNSTSDEEDGSGWE